MSRWRLRLREGKQLGFNKVVVKRKVPSELDMLVALKVAGIAG